MHHNFLRTKRKTAFFAALVLFSLLWLLLSSLNRASAPARDPAGDARFAAALARAPPPGAATYTPSRIEAQWAAHGREWSGELCARIAAERSDWQRWFDAAANGGKGAPEAWSTLAVAAGPGARLEPLAGFLRDPRSYCPGLLTPALTRHTDDAKAHLFLDPAFYARLAASLRRAPVDAAPPPRALLFDLGSTRWDSSPDPETGPYGARWLVDAYAGLGIEFDSVYAWEARAVDARDYFGSMPLALAGRWHFYNFPVAGPRHGEAAQGAQLGPEDPLELLRAAARPSDFVVLKVDIDTERLEESIVVQLLLDEQLGALVDDLYFEHHVQNNVVLGWGGGWARDLKDSIDLFQALRRRGIRAHSWP
jgi:hypothetical protein